MATGSVLAAGMLLLWSQAQSLSTLFVAWTGLGIAMAAILYDPLFAVLTREYPASFRTKITLVTLVGGFASTAFIPLTQFLIGSLGWRGALVSLGIISLVVCLPIHVVALGRRRTDDGAACVHTPAKRDAPAPTRRALRTPAFWALVVCFTAYYATFAALTFHLVPLMIERHISSVLIVATMATIGPAQVAARALWFAFGRNVRPSTTGMIVTTAFPASVAILLCANDSPFLLIPFAIVYGGANGMMTILRGTIVQDVMWSEGFGAISGLLSLPSNLAKGIAPISAAALWSIRGSYVPVEWDCVRRIADFGGGIFRRNARHPAPR